MAAHDFALRLGRSLLEAIEPLQEWLTDREMFERLMLRHGWTPPEDSSYFPSVKAAFSLVEEIPDLLETLEDLRSSTDPGDWGQATDDVVDFVRRMFELSELPDAPPPFDEVTFWRSFPKDVLQTEIAALISARYPGIYAALSLFGVIEVRRENASTGRFAHDETRVDWSRLAEMVLNPVGRMRTAFGWGGTPGQFKAAEMLAVLERAMLAFHSPAHREIPPATALDPYFDAGPNYNAARRLMAPIVIESRSNSFMYEAGLTVLPIPPRDQKTQPPIGLFISPYFIGSGAAEIPLGGPFQLELEGQLSSGGDVGIELRPGEVRFKGGTGNVDLSMAVAARPQEPFLLLGREEETRLEAKDLSVGLHIVGPADDADLRFRIGTTDLRAVVQIESEDGFLGKIFGGSGIDARAAVALVWSSKRGLLFEGSGGLMVDIPANFSIGPITIQKIKVGLASAGGITSAQALVTGGLAMGPVNVSVEEIGVGINLENKGENAALFGNLHADFDFLPPRGLGIAIDAGTVQGGGFLYFNPDEGRYAGAMELKIYSVSVKAFGVVDTKMPDGSSGFSFVIVISAEFNPIQLGMGFTLNGVGGILGIHRRVDSDVLQQMILGGPGSENLLFPKNVAASAPRIISDLRSVFPVAEDKYVFGPMAKIGWGTPTLIEAVLGLVLEIPGPRIVMLGEVRCALPKPDNALVQLNMSIMGVLDFPKKLFAFVSSLRNSRVGSFPISGDMAMRIMWGDEPNFAMAVGGFHPSYQAPPQFPSLKRVSIDLGAADGNPSIVVQGYLAVTSNSAQVGVSAALRANKYGIRLSCDLSLDAIFIFSPFSFEVKISANVRVTFHGYGIGVHLGGKLTGPSPWHIRASLSVSVLWWDASLPIDLTFGERKTVSLPSLDPWLGNTEVQGLKDALEKPRTWTPAPPAGAFAVVSYAPGAAENLVDPMGAVVASQQVCPLNIKLHRFGPVKALGSPFFKVESATLNGEALAVGAIGYVKQHYAPGSFFELKDSEKLSMSAFQKLDGGIRVPGSAANSRAGSLQTKAIEYKTRIKGKAGEVTPPHVTPNEHLAGMTERSAAATQGARRTGGEAFHNPLSPKRFNLAAENYAVRSALNIAQQVVAVASKIEATLALDEQPRRSDYRVIPEFEWKL